MNELTFKRMTPLEIWGADGIQNIIEQCYEECANKAMGAAKPDLELYEIYQNAGMIKALGVFDGKSLVGGVAILFSPMAHFAKRGATVESLFLLPKYRHLGVGRRLIAEAKALAKEAGVLGLYITAPKGSRLEAMLIASGVRQTNTVFFEAV